jgi:uncharacterized OB-fold protein
VSEYGKPLPSLGDEVTAPYWRAAAEHRLVLPRCQDCGTAFFYPRRFCPSCWSARIGWFDAAGTGTVWSFTWVHVAFYDDTWKDDVPYCVAVVELDEGVRLVSSIVDADPDRLAIGDAVRVCFDDVTPDVTLPRFEVEA